MSVLGYIDTNPFVWKRNFFIKRRLFRVFSIALLVYQNLLTMQLFDVSVSLFER